MLLNPRNVCHRPTTLHPHLNIFPSLDGAVQDSCNWAKSRKLLLPCGFDGVVCIVNGTRFPPSTLRRPDLALTLCLLQPANSFVSLFWLMLSPSAADQVIGPTTLLRLCEPSRRISLVHGRGPIALGLRGFYDDIVLGPKEATAMAWCRRHWGLSKLWQSLMGATL